MRAKNAASFSDTLQMNSCNGSLNLRKKAESNQTISSGLSSHSNGNEKRTRRRDLVKSEAGASKTRSHT